MVRKFRIYIDELKIELFNLNIIKIIKLSISFKPKICYNFLGGNYIHSRKGIKCDFIKKKIHKKNQQLT